MVDGNGHTAYFYDNESTRDKAIVKFINEGLKNNEFCIFATVDYDDKKKMTVFRSKISKCDENIKKDNLLFVDCSPYKIFGSGGYLAQFESLKKKIDEKIKVKKNRKSRCVGDFSSFLFQNKYFDECILLEEWAQKNRDNMSRILCPYPSSIFESSPYKDHLLRIFKNHDDIIDDSGKVISKYTY